MRRVHPVSLSALTVLAAGLGVTGPALSATADDIYWGNHDDPFDATNHGAYIGPGYWFGLVVPDASDTAFFGSIGFPPPHAGNQTYGPHIVHFGAFNYRSFLSGITTEYPAVDAHIERLNVRDGVWTFDFGSGHGGFGSKQPPPSMGSLTVRHETVLADAVEAGALLNIRAGVLHSDYVVHLAPGNLSIATVDVSGSTAGWSVDASITLGWVGAGTIQISDGAHVSVAGDIAAGVRDGSNGSIIVSDGGSYATLASIALGSGHESTGNAHGDMLITGGDSEVRSLNTYVGSYGSADATVRAGARLEAVELLRVCSDSTHGRLSIIDATAHARRVSIGEFGADSDNRCSVRGIHAHLSADEQITVGDNDVSGLLEVSSDAHVEVVEGYLDIGARGHGTMSLQTGATAACRDSRIGWLPGSSGSIAIASSNGVPSQYAVTSRLSVGGGFGSAPGGPASVTVGSDGLLSVGVRLTTWRQGSVELRAGGRGLVGAGDLTEVEPGSLVIGPGGTLSGDGVIHGKVVNAGGLIDPGHSPGVLTIDGSLAINAASTMFLEIGGTAQGTYDQLDLRSSPSLALDGALHVRFVTGYIPHDGDAFNLFLMGKDTDIAGSFSQVHFDNLPQGWDYSLSFDATTGAIQLVIIACPVDFDGDGFVTSADFDLFVQAFETGDAWSDFDGDGFITGVDFDSYVVAYEAGC